MIGVVRKQDVVVFNENHKWCGCLGYVDSYKENVDIYVIGVPIPERGVAYIRCNSKDIEYIGKYPFILEEFEDEEE
jgi:hypothetical protein